MVIEIDIDPTSVLCFDRSVPVFLLVDVVTIKAGVEPVQVCFHFSPCFDAVGNFYLDRCAFFHYRMSSFVDRAYIQQ
jgi:hypothetical protein